MIKQEGPLPSPEGEAQRPLIGILGGGSRLAGNRSYKAPPAGSNPATSTTSEAGPGCGANRTRPLDQPLGG
jgi:hypothetical protein